MKKRIIPDAYTDYEDGHLGLVPASLANVEAKIGAAEDGQPYKVYTLAGPDAKKTAKTIFKGGPLLHSLEEAFDAGSTRIHAVRIGSGARAGITLYAVPENIEDFISGPPLGVETMKILGEWSLAGNNHALNITHEFHEIDTGLMAVSGVGGERKVIIFNEDSEIENEFVLPDEIVQTVGVSSKHLLAQFLGSRAFHVLGLENGTGNPCVWSFDADGQNIPDGKIDLTQLVDDAEQPLALNGVVTGVCADFDFGNLLVTTTTHHYSVKNRNPESLPPLCLRHYAWNAYLTENPTDVSSQCYQIDLGDLMRGDESTLAFIALERTAKKLYRFSLDDNDQPQFVVSADLSAIPEFVDLIPEGVASDYENRDIYVSGSVTGGLPEDPQGRVVRLSIDWSTTPNPTVTVLETMDAQNSLVGLDHFIAELDITTKATIQDRNESPYLVRTYEGRGGLQTTTLALAQAINAGGVYEAVLQTETPKLLMPTLETGGGPPDPTSFESFTGGEDSTAPTNGDYLNGLAATASKTDTSWIHAVGANTNALWTAILLHCSEMFENHHAERFAILETPEFSTTFEEGSAGYLTDLQDYVDSIVTMMETVADKNAVVFPGGAVFLDSDGNEYTRPLTDSCGGTMAGLEVQKSLINKPVKNIVRLVPPFSPGHIQSLIQARVNCVRFKPGRGFIIAHSLTAAAPGSDYSRVNDLRAVYYGSKAAREAAQPYVGEENDAAGEGLRRLESAMSRPLEQMRDAGQIDDFELTAVSTPQDRLLGDAYVSLGIQPRRAIEMIYTTVYLK